MKNKTNVVVIGAPRSGTTLLSGLLSADAAASPMLPECSYITQIIRHYHDFLNYSDPQRFAAYAIDQPTLAAMYRSMVDSMIATAQSHFSKLEYRYLILKDPELTPLVDLIPTFFGEDSKTVCIVRDPRAVIASMMEVNRRKRKAARAAWLKTPNLRTSNTLLRQLISERRLLVDFFAYYWRLHASEQYKRGAVHIVRFEKVVARDEDEFRRLEEYLGFTVGREGFGKMYFDFDRNDPTFSVAYGKPIQPKSDDFLKTLSRLQRWRIEKVFSEMNAIYGWWN